MFRDLHGDRYSDAVFGELMEIGTDWKAFQKVLVDIIKACPDVQSNEKVLPF